MGPPGVGKGTQAERIIEELNIIHLSTGEILRDEIKNRSDIGIKAKQFMSDGKLVPDDVLLGSHSSSLSPSFRFAHRPQTKRASDSLFKY